MEKKCKKVSFPTPFPLTNGVGGIRLSLSKIMEVQMKLYKIYANTKETGMSRCVYQCESYGEALNELTKFRSSIFAEDFELWSEISERIDV